MNHPPVNGVDLADATAKQMREIRRHIGIVFQDPGSSLNPRFPIDRCQRVGIARALALNQSLFVADEPTSALDVSVQARFLDLLQDLQQKLQFACLFVSHDLAVVDVLVHRTSVMHKGKLVESDLGIRSFGIRRTRTRRASSRPSRFRTRRPSANVATAGTPRARSRARSVRYRSATSPSISEVVPLNVGSPRWPAHPRWFERLSPPDFQAAVHNCRSASDAPCG
jgi:ABC-type methionine transport system ATPase subunit